MFVYERHLEEEDYALYEKVFRYKSEPAFYDWVIDRDRQIFITASGKYGPETPMFFEMCYNGMLCTFGIYEIYEPYKEFLVFIPGELENCSKEIEQAIREAAGALSQMTLIPETLVDQVTRFYIDNFKSYFHNHFVQRMHESISEKAGGSV